MPAWVDNRRMLAPWVPAVMEAGPGRDLDHWHATGDRAQWALRLWRAGPGIGLSQIPFSAWQTKPPDTVARGYEPARGWLANFAWIRQSALAANGPLRLYCRHSERDWAEFRGPGARGMGAAHKHDAHWQPGTSRTAHNAHAAL